MQVGLVLLRKSGEIDIGLGKVDTLVRGEGTVVQGPDVNVGAVDRGDEESEDTVIDVDVLAGGCDLGQVFLLPGFASEMWFNMHGNGTHVVHEQNLIVACLRELSVDGDDKLVAGLDWDLRSRGCE